MLVRTFLVQSGHAEAFRFLDEVAFPVAGCSPYR